MLEGVTDGSSPRRYDVLEYSDDHREVVPAGDGERVVSAHRAEDRRRRRIATATVGIVGVLVGAVGTGWLASGLVIPLGVGVLIGTVGGAVRYQLWQSSTVVPEVVAADVSETTVRQYVDEFDPSTVSSPVAS